MGVIFLVWGIVLIGWEKMLLIAVLGGIGLMIVIHILTSLLRRLFGRLGGLLPIALALSMALMINAAVTYDVLQQKDLSTALFIAAALSFVVYGVCISSPRHETSRNH